jgi:TetR/AcrR family fatty acid metabolism transcriptional regulator
MTPHSWERLVTTAKPDVGKRVRILDAAVVEIANNGYHQTTVAKIARRAGVADGTIYLYFKGKGDILCAVFDRAMDRFISEGVLEMGDLGDAKSRLREIIRLHLEQVGQDHDLALILQIELRHNVGFMELFSRSRLRDYLEILSGVVIQGQNEGLFRPEMDPVLTAKMIFGVLDQMTTDWVLSQRNTRLASRAGEVADFLLGAIQIRGPELP